GRSHQRDEFLLADRKRDVLAGNATVRAELFAQPLDRKEIRHSATVVCAARKSVLLTSLRISSLQSKNRTVAQTAKRRGEAASGEAEMAEESGSRTHQRPANGLSRI